MQDQSSVKGAVRLKRDLYDPSGSFASSMEKMLDRIGFTDVYVDGCVKHVDSTGAKHKALKDAVWGMMEFDIGAMRLIDSPLLQRLRRIKQLGFSYLTYPSAEHSRFPHTVGMAHVITKFLDAIDRRHGDIESFGSVLPKAELFAQFDKHFKDWSPEEDALRIAADLINDPKFPHEASQVAKQYGWDCRRMNLL